MGDWPEGWVGDPEWLWAGRSRFDELWGNITNIDNDII